MSRIYSIDQLMPCFESMHCSISLVILTKTNLQGICDVIYKRFLKILIGVVFKWPRFLAAVKWFVCVFVV